MNGDDRNANVVLSADVNQYNQQVAQASTVTSRLTQNVDKLASSLDGITKRTGKKLLLFSAADTAAVVGYTSAAAKYEKQLTTLNAQTAIAGKTMDIYKRGIEGLARQMPITGKEVVALITQINQLGITSQRETVAMARSFIQLSAATGDSLTSLTSGLIELSRQMGTLGLGAQGIANFADSLTTVSNNAGVSATQVLNFANSIAPMARAAGMGQKEVLGISAAFTRAGADGYAAANTFNSIISDITRQVMTGSPEIAKYAKTVGLTVDEFKSLGATEQVTRIFEAINKAGPDSVRLLDRMGIDGIRAAKSIQAVAAESGGLRKAITEATAAYGSGSTATGAAAAFSSMDSETTKLRNNLEQIAATMGSVVLPVATKFVELLNAGLSAVNAMGGPLLAVAGALGAVIAPLTAGFGGLLTLMGPLSTLMMAMTAFRLSPVRGLIQGIQEGRAAAGAAKLGMEAVPFTQAGKLNAEGGLKAYQAGPFRLGQRLGGMLPYQMPGAPNPYGQILMRGGIGAAGLVNDWYVDPTKTMYANAAMLDPFARKSATGDLIDRAVKARSGIFSTLSGAITNPYGTFMARGAQPADEVNERINREKIAREAADRAAAEGRTRRMSVGLSQQDVERGARADFDRVMKEHSDAWKRAATSAEETAKANGLTTKTFKDLAGAWGRAGAGVASIPLAAGSMGVRLAGQGAAKVGGALLSSVGGLVGVGGAPGMAVGAGLLVGGGIAYAAKQANDAKQAAVVTDQTAVNLGRINTALGLATKTLGEFTTSLSDGTRSADSITSATQGFRLTMDEQMSALRSPNAYADTRVQGLSGKDAAVSYLMSLGQMSGQQARAASMDLYRRFGPDAQSIIDAYQKSEGGFLTQSMSGIASGLFPSAQQSTDSGLVGWLRNAPVLSGFGNWFGSDQNTTDAVGMAVAAAREQAGMVAQKYGGAAGSAKLASNFVDLLNAANDTSTSGGRQTLEQLVKNLEQQYGELGLYTNPSGALQGNFGGGTLDSGAALLRYIASGQNTSAGAVGMRQALEGTGMSLTDFIGPNAKNANQLAIALQRGNLSDYEKAVRGTKLGAFARDNAAILAVTEGTDEGSPQAVGKALRAMVDGLTQAGTAFGQVTKSANETSIAAGDNLDKLYQLAQAAKSIAYAQGLQNATQTRGELGGVQYRMSQIRQDINSPIDSKSGLEDWTALQGEVDQNARAYENVIFQFQRSTQRSWEDFKRQQLYSVEDFSLSMSRSMEDAAKSLYSPFQRAFSPATASLDAIVSNMIEGRQRVSQQMTNLGRLQKMGLSKQAIDQMQLTDPTMAWQVERMLTDAQTPGGRRRLRRINAESGRRDSLAQTVVGEQQSTQRAQEDFARSQKRSSDAFHLGLTRAMEDLDTYNRHVNGTTQDVLTSVQTMFNDLGLSTTTYFELLKAEVGSVGSAAPTARSPKATKAQLEGGVGETTPYSVGPKSDYPFPQGYQWGEANPNQPTRGARGNNYPQPRKMATGGWVTGPTFAYLGEGGFTEAVVPLGGAEGRTFMTQMATQITSAMVRAMHTANRGTPAFVKGGDTHYRMETKNVYEKVYVTANNTKQMEKELANKARDKRARQGAAAGV